MSPVAASARSLESVLTRLGAKLSPWQVRALFLGAQASTSIRLGPQHLIDTIFGTGPTLGEDLQDANANLQVLMGTWNDLVTKQGRGHVRLSPFDLRSPADPAQIQALAERRLDEIAWSTRGIDAGGDDPLEYGAEGEELLQDLAQSSAYLQAYRELLQKTPSPSAKELADAARSLHDLGDVIERTIHDLMTVSNVVRRHALEEYQERSGHPTDDGVPTQHAVKVGRNEQCPCGSGRKWKKCCGATTH
jgi:uncharacterized protein YchJ